ncbi:hypothetical protein EDD17DRAFT_1512766 [Pisolithus thermaeus]|nr:hypothetical protein EDD17DRAFT_1512766 [Pisolithus thermaeus]
MAAATILANYFLHIPNWLPIAEHYIRCLLIFEYCYFLLQNDHSPAEQDVIPLAIKEYKGFNVATTVYPAVETAVQQYDHSVDELCQALLQVVLQNHVFLAWK